MTSSWLISKQFGPMILMIAELRARLVAFLHHAEDIRGVLAESASHHVNIAREFFMAAKQRTERPAEGEIGVEDLRDQALICFVPHLETQNCELAGYLLRAR